MKSRSISVALRGKSALLQFRGWVLRPMTDLAGWCCRARCGHEIRNTLGEEARQARHAWFVGVDATPRTRPPGAMAGSDPGPNLEKRGFFSSATGDRPRFHVGDDDIMGAFPALSSSFRPKLDCAAPRRRLKKTGFAGAGLPAGTRSPARCRPTRGGNWSSPWRATSVWAASRPFRRERAHLLRRVRAVGESVRADGPVIWHLGSKSGGLAQA